MPSCSEVRVPEPECPLIIPCAAKNSLILSRNWVTLLFSYFKKGWEKKYNGGENPRKRTTCNARADIP